MYGYTFSTLNDKEFESLAIDLLSAEIGLRIERFKPGKDKGVDGRWFSASKAEVIVQCKHWLSSGLDRMLAHLATSERPKLDKLSCSRYILVTSLPLSRVNKQRIAAVMAPYILSESDILGAEDLNDLLGRHTEVERRHYKLWLSSTNVLSLLLNNAIIGRSNAELEQIWHDAPIYVKTTDYGSASRQLNDKRVLILTGEPGIGKTTLARQLVLEYAVNGFELVVLEESISEAENVYSKESKQLFYFDDFLGRTFLEALKAKQDSHILRFVERVARDSRKRFILTSRTNILNQGAALSDLYADVSVVKNTYELRIGALSPLDRARILYNHIWHSKLSPDFVDELYVQKRYRQVIAHRNFNPRLVAFVVDAGKVTDVAASQYWSFVVSTLQNPSGVWSHFFSAQLSQDDRDLVYLVVLAGGSIGEQQLRDAFFAIPSPEPENKGLIDSRFWRAVQHTAGSVLNRSLSDGGTRPSYALYNPSIADFVQSQLSKSRLWGYYYGCLRSVSYLSRLQQIRKQPFHG
jgi:adenylate kinase family enzyme